MNFKKNILLSLLACLLWSNVVQAGEPGLVKKSINYFLNGASLTEEEEKQVEDNKKASQQKKSDKRVEIEADRESEYSFPFSQKSSMAGMLSRNIERHLVWSVSSTIFLSIQDLIFKGILDEGLNRIKRKVQRYCLTSPLVKNTIIEEDLYLDDLILSEEIRGLAQSIIGTFKNTEISSGCLPSFLGGKSSVSRVRFNGYLFHGLPGTGKTELAKIIASEISRDSELGEAKDIKYYEVSGHKLATANLNEIEDFIGMIETSNALTIVVIDECETFLADTQGKSSKNMSKGVNAWVEYTGKPSSHVQFFYMTNFEKSIDKRMRRRMDFIEFKYPDLQGRIKLLDRYIEKEFLLDKAFSAGERAQIEQLFNKDTLENIAQRLCIPQENSTVFDSGNVFAPSNIETIMVEMKSRSIGLGCHGVPTASIMNAVLDQAIARKKGDCLMEQIQEFPEKK